MQSTGLPVEFLSSRIRIFISGYCVVLFIYSWSEMMVSLMLSPGFCSSNTGSLQSGFQTHVVRRSPRRLFPFIPLHLGLNPTEAASPSSLCGPGFASYALGDSIFMQGFAEQSCVIILVSGLSPCLEHKGPTDGPWASVGSCTH